MYRKIPRERLKQIFESISQGVICLEADGRVSFINQKAREVFGPDAEKCFSRDSKSRPWRLIYEDGSTCPDQEHPANLTLRTGKTLSGQIRGVVWRDRPLTWVAMETSPIMAGNRETPDAVVVIATDITKQRRAEELQAITYRRQQIAIDLAKLVQWEYDIDEDRFIFDEKFYELYGTSASEQGGNRMSSGEYARRFLPPEDVPVVAGEIEAALATEDPEFTRQLGHRIIVGDGQTKHIIVRYSIVKDSAGRTIKLYGANQDITEFKAVEERLRGAQAVSHTGSWQLDIPRDELSLSDEALRLFGFSDQPPGSMEDLRARIHPEDRRTVDEAWSGALQGNPYVVQYRVDSGEGLRWISERGVTKFAPDGDPLTGIGTVQDITERKLALMRLESSERRFRALIEASAQIVWSCDSKGYVSEDSPSWRAYTGQTFEQYKGLGYAEAIHPDDREQNFAELREGLAKGEPVSNAYRVRHHSGQWRWNQARTVPIKDKDGRTLTCVGMNIDINDQREAEDALKESENRFYKVMYHAPIGLAILSPEGRWIDVNPSLYRILGYTRDELLTSDFQTITHPDDLDADLEYVRQVLDGEIQTYQMDKRYFHKDGHIVWAQLNVALVRDDKGEPKYFISQILDISERKSNELEIKESEHRFRSIIDASPIPLALEGDHGNIIYINPAFTECFGYSLEDLPNLAEWWAKAYPDLAYREEVQRDWLQRIEKSYKGGTPFVPLEVRICCKDGTYRTVLATSTQLSGFAEQTSLVTLYDITQTNNMSMRLKTLLATASDGIHVLDEQGNVVEFSESFARMLGYSPEELWGLNVADWDVMIPVKKLQPTIKQLMNASSTFETRHRRKDGSLFDAEINAKGIVLDGRRLLYASSRDITERKKALLALAESEERFNLAISGSNDGIWDWKIPNNTLFWSPRFKEILGCGDDEIEVSQDTWLSMVHPDDREASRTALMGPSARRYSL